MAGLDPTYETAIATLPGVRSFKAIRAPAELRSRGFDAKLKLRTEAGDRELLTQVYRSHLGHKTMDHIVAAVRKSPKPVLILAPHIGGGLAAKLIAARVNYLDAHGNCHIAAPPLYIHIEGKSAVSLAPADKGLRSPAYQVLFTYLAEPSLLDAPLRTVAELAGVSRQPVFNMRHRLIDDEYVFDAKSKIRWRPQRIQDALGLWLHGYETAVRSSLLWGAYRTQDKSPADLERRLVKLFSDAENLDFRWGGNAAGFRLTEHYRGDTTVVHVHTMPHDLPRRLRALSDPRGNLVLMNAFGKINWAANRDTVHPLLVYSEMLFDGSERSREAAQQLYDEHLAPVWGREA